MTTNRQLAMEEIAHLRELALAIQEAEADRARAAVAYDRFVLTLEIRHEIVGLNATIDGSTGKITVNG